ncbi:MAG: DUF2478 domain-containing protein [Nitratireductor sp.]
MTDQPLAIAAIRFGDGDRIDDLLETVARTIGARGCRVAGYLQRETPDGPGCCGVMYLEDIAGGARTRMSQALGAGARGCRLDPQALAEAACRLQASIGPQTDLVVLNRFGKGESDGHGFRSVIAQACELGVPVLTAVRETYRPFWEEFTGGVGALLPPDAEEATRWAVSAASARRSPRAA